ncbi:uncharacterized protein [Dermacentor albipictus]|uniref:uncharacterized protein isoform X1 n=1 Tax=Dermacentor albipictus TaxID=60249 RepID=UPI0038FD36D0
MATKIAGPNADTERVRVFVGGTNSDRDGRQRHQPGRPAGRQQQPGNRSPSVPPSPATTGRATTSQESLRSATNEASRGADGGRGFRHMFDSCAHCDWIWKGDACDIFYRELAESQTESITYELASRPDPGLFARFFGEKGYQRGRRATHDDQAAASGSRDPASPTRGTWASDADWRAQISNLATHEKKSRKSAKLMLAQQALNRLRHWTSGHHHHHHHAMTTDPNGGSPVRQDLMDDAKSAEEAKTLLRRPRVEDCPEAYSEDMSTVAGGGVGCVAGAKTSSSAGDLLLGLGPTHFKAISRRVQSSTAVAVKAQDAGYARASGDFCCPTAANGVFAPEVRALSAASSEETWSTTTTTSKKGGHHFASSQRSIDGFFKRLVRKK